MSDQKPAAKREGPLDQPFKFRVLIEGGCMADSEETVRAYVLSSVSFSAGLGQQIESIKVAAAPQDAGPSRMFDPNGVRGPRRN